MKTKTKTKQRVWFIILLLGLIVFFSTGCKSIKSTVKTDMKEVVEEKVNDSSSEAVSENKEETAHKNENKSITDNTVTIVIETKYSVPDSTGTQHKTEEKKTEQYNNIYIHSELSEIVIRSQASEIERLNSVISDLNKKVESSSTSTKKVDNRTSIWVYLIVFLVGAILALFLLYKFKGKLKRFKLFL